MPFGEDLSGFGNRNLIASYNMSAVPTEKFTGKERDAESGLDYFGARYYSGAQGRFTSPDWSEKPQPVPYASLRDPQTLNLYAYVRNNPLSIRDIDGHGWWKDFWNGLADSTYRPLVTLVRHPIVTGRNLGSAITHPIATANAIRHGVVTTTVSAFHGNGAAIGVAVGTIGMAFIPGAGEAGEGAEAAADLGRVGEVAEAAETTANATKALASDLQVQEILSGTGTPLAGAGTGTALRDAPRLAATYGGQEADWVKIGSSHATPTGGAGGFEKAGYNGGFEVHAYKNVKTGQVVELKTKFQ
jgi:RHS repeat-associated protein